MRVLIDVSVIVRMLLPSPNPFRAVDLILTAGLEHDFVFLVPYALRNELLATIAGKRHLAAQIPLTIAEGLLSELEQRGERLPSLLGPYASSTRDPNDNYLVAYALFGQADYLLTGDQDLLVLDGQFPFRIVTPPEFLAVLREQELA